jgi:hypothetical protein
MSSAFVIECVSVGAARARTARTIELGQLRTSGLDELIDKSTHNDINAHGSAR